MVSMQLDSVVKQHLQAKKPLLLDPLSHYYALYSSQYLLALHGQTIWTPGQTVPLYC